MERKKENKREKEREVNTTTTKKEREKYREKKTGRDFISIFLSSISVVQPVKICMQCFKTLFYI